MNLSSTERIKPTGEPLWGLFLMTGLLLGGCDRHQGAAPDAPSKLHIACVVYPLASLAAQVSGQRADLEWFCENGQDPRDLHLTDDQKQHARHADLILTSGFGDAWASSALTTKQQSLRLIQPEQTPTGRSLSETPGAIWLHPLVAREMVESVRERLATLDTKDAPEYRKAADGLTSEIDRIDDDFRTRLAPFNGRKFLSLRPTWGPIVQRYVLEEITPVDTDARHLTDEDVRKLKKAAKEEGTTLLVIDAALLPGVRRELAQRTGLRLILLDPLGSSAPEGRSTWARIMRYNLDQLEGGLK